MGYSAEITKSGTYRYHFQVTGTGGQEKTIRLLTTPEDSGRRLLVTGEEEFDIELGELDFRPYFAVELSAQTLITAERTLPVEGMNNFRDMGGYETGDGRHVKWGCLYRSDHIFNATAQGMEYLRKLGIRTIIDYRSKDEREKYPNGVLSEATSTIWLDPDAHTAELSAQFTSSKDSEDEALVNKIISQKEQGALVDRYDMVMEQYGNFVCKEESKKAFGAMIRAVAAPGAAAVVQHCRGGKDRTGFGSMLLLGLLGVGRESLIADYMLTYHNRVKRNRVKMEIYRRYTQDPVVLDYLYSLIDTRPEFITASYDKIMDGYGTIEEYAKKELQVTECDIIRLKELYLQ